MAKEELDLPKIEMPHFPDPFESLPERCVGIAQRRERLAEK